MRLVIEKRKSVSQTAKILVPILSFVFSLLFGAVLLVISGANPLHTYVAMLDGAFGGTRSLTETLLKAVPLMLTGLGVSIAFRMLFWNIGAEGQFVFGGVAAAYVALFIAPHLPSWGVLPLTILIGALAGAIWGAIPAVLRAYLDVNETITTLMMNYVAILWASHLFTGPWRDPEGYGFPGSAPFPPEARLPYLFGRVHIGIIFAVVAAVVLWFVLKRTKWGFEIRVTGENPKAARYIGINIHRNIVLVMLVSGGLCGLAGATEATGLVHRLQRGIIAGYGYTAIIVAWLSELNPLAILMVAFFLAALITGGDQIQLAMGLPAAMASVLQGALLFPMLGGALFVDYRLRLVREHEDKSEAGSSARTEEPEA